MADGDNRLACTDCDREDYDGVAILPSGWYDAKYQGEDEDIGVWWNWMGTCPKCQQKTLL